MDQAQESKNFFAIIIAGTIIGIFIFLSGLNNSPKAIVGDISEKETSQEKIVFDSKCINFLDAAKHIGEKGCVVGRIVSVFVSNSGTTFFDYCKDYKTCQFTAVIFKSDSKKFGDVSIYNGKNLEISGLIKSYQGKAEIILNDPSQIKIID
ncbi:MAG TPA: hypothetical protein PLA41_03140 [Candidatus Pacearchaeota archaeon]|nr:hypothetical protein [Candidatus Parcubacteria bacterium]HOU46109.1 hypothetical protein [Candidatus Pacearchaeota archaeon]HQI74669.1 hypothetical protein [Candidatus Pacearchaeota archaeon]